MGGHGRCHPLEAPVRRVSKMLVVDQILPDGFVFVSPFMHGKTTAILDLLRRTRASYNYALAISTKARTLEQHAAAGNPTQLLVWGTNRSSSEKVAHLDHILKLLSDRDGHCVAVFDGTDQVGLLAGATALLSIFKAGTKTNMTAFVVMHETKEVKPFPAALPCAQDSRGSDKTCSLQRHPCPVARSRSQQLLTARPPLPKRAMQSTTWRSAKRHWLRK